MKKTTSNPIMTISLPSVILEGIKMSNMHVKKSVFWFGAEQAVYSESTKVFLLKQLLGL